MNNQPVIAIIGGSFWGNRGAAAMLETTIARIRQVNADTRFHVFTPYPARDPNLVKDSSLEYFDSRPHALLMLTLQTLWYWLARKVGFRPKVTNCLRSIAGASVLLDIGGVTFSDGRLIFLPYNIITIWPAMLLGIHVVKMSQAAGPFTNPIIRWMAKIFLPRCHHFFARGEKTLEYLRDLGLAEEKLSQCSDVAFSYRKEYCLTAENNTAVKDVCRWMDGLKKDGKKVIAISPSVLVMEKSSATDIDYCATLVKLVGDTYDQDCHFVIFPNASREHSRKMRNNDLQVIARMRAMAELQLHPTQFNRITWMEYDVDTAGIEDIVKRADVLVASRFHAMVFGLRLCIPTIVIGWGHKYQEAMKYFNQEDLVFDYRESKEDLSRVLTDVIRDSSWIRKEMMEHLPGVVQFSETQFSYLRTLLHG